MNVDREKIGKVDDKLLDVLQLDMQLLDKLKNNIDILAYDNKISIEGYILFIADKKTDLKENHLDKRKLYRILEGVLEQQFYIGEDYIVDRIGTNKIRIKNADLIINDTLLKLIDASSEWLIGRYSETIIKYSLLFNISFIEIMINFKEKYDRLVTNLEDEMTNGEIIENRSTNFSIKIFLNILSSIFSNFCNLFPSTKVNAAVTGFGKTLRIMLGDTLLQKFREDEIEIVMAHEIAHQKNKDVYRSILFNGLIAFLGFYFVDLGFDYFIEWFDYYGKDDPATSLKYFFVSL